MLKFADIANKGPIFNPMQFIRKSSYILTPKNPLIGRIGGPEARMSTVVIAFFKNRLTSPCPKMFSDYIARKTLVIPLENKLLVIVEFARVIFKT